MVARSNEPLQSEAGYIDARPQTRSTNLLATHGRTIQSGHRLASHRCAGYVSCTPESCRSFAPPRSSARCQSTKSLRDNRCAGCKSREGGGQLREQCDERYRSLSGGSGCCMPPPPRQHTIDMSARSSGPTATELPATSRSPNGRLAFAGSAAHHSVVLLRLGVPV